MVHLQGTKQLIFVLSFYFIVNSVNGIIGGRVPKLNEVKYQVAVLSGNICGGGIIGDKYVITAAHCLKVDRKFNTLNATRVVASTNDTAPLSKGAIIKYVRRAFIPSSYIPGGINAASDIAVLELTGSIEIEKHSDKLQKLDLPEPPSSGPEVYTDYNTLKVKIAGFGQTMSQEVKDANGGVTYKTFGSGHLRVANATVFDWATCRKHYRATMNYRMCIKITENRPSAKIQGTCYGDSGSPVVLDGKVVLGVVSSHLGKSCNSHKSPGIVIRTSSFLPFIKNAMNGRITKEMKVYRAVR